MWQTHTTHGYGKLGQGLWVSTYCWCGMQFHHQIELHNQTNCNNLIPFITGVIHQDNQGQCRELLLLEAMIDKRNSFEENPRPIYKPQTNQ
jgi:hypothetical protein